MQNCKVYSSLNFKMMRNKFQINFMFVFYGIIQVNYSFLQEREKNVRVFFQEEKCVNNNCCDVFRKLPTGIVCRKSMIPPYESYIFEFTDIKYLPARVFQDKLIRSIYIDDPDVTVDTNVLDGISALGTFYVQRSKIKIIPDFRFVKDSIVVIKVMSSFLTSLDGKNLQKLSVVEHLSFPRNFIRFIDPHVFKGTVNVKELDLSANLLTFIPANVFNPMKNLTTFIANYNNFVHINKLFSVTRPLDIDLTNNNITDFGTALHISLKNVQKMAIGTIIKCDGNEYVEHIHKFLSLSIIRRLDLSNNLINETLNSIFPCYYSGRDDRTGHFLEIRTLILNGNRVKNFNFLLRYLIINKLSVAINQIEFLTDEDFKFTRGAETLILQKNKIKRIDANTFKPFRLSLKTLDLSSNLIKSLNRSTRLLIQLRTLYIGHNFIVSFATDEFSGLEELILLNIEHNQIKNIDLLQQLPYLQSLNVKNNDIESITLDPVPKTLKLVYLADNPIELNCLFHRFIRGLNVSSITTDVDSFSKAGFGAAIQKKPNSQNVCSYGCTDFENESFMFIDCSSKNLNVVPKFIRNNLMEVEIVSGHWLSVVLILYDPFPNPYVYEFEDVSKRIIYSTFHVKDKVLGINLENNSLESLETVHFPPNLIRLYLSENKLKRLPESIMDNQRNLRQVTLSGNPWKCDCDALKFKKWLTLEKAIIKDIDNVRCGIIGKEDSHLNRRIVWKLTDLDLCPTQNDQILITSVSSGVLTFVIFCLAAKVLYTKYELNIKVFLYSRGFTFVKEEDLDYDKIFDAFISFCHDDDEFVIKEIVSVIEKRNPNIRLCLHYRHFIAGELIVTNITRAVRNSKRTVLILSRNFLESEWCLLEARTAHAQAMENKVHRIIVIKVGDLPEEMDPLIKAYLSSTTYITWEESNFWNKLLYVLPSPISSKETDPDSMEENETVC